MFGRMLKNKHFVVKVADDDSIVETEDEVLYRTVLIERSDIILALKGTATIVLGYKALDTVCRIAIIRASR